MAFPVYLSTVFTIVLVSVIVLLLALTAFLIWMLRVDKKETGEGKLDFDILEEKVVSCSRSKKARGARKAAAILGNCFFFLVLGVCAVLIFTRAMPGLGIPYSLGVVLTPSMSTLAPEREQELQGHDERLQVDDIVVIERVDSLEDIKLYDIVSYAHPEGINVIHRVVGFYDDGSLLTQGDANSTPDNVRVTLEMVNGRYAGIRIPVLGSITIYLQDDYGILGMSSLAYCIIAAEIYFGLSDKRKEERLKAYDGLFAKGAREVIYSCPEGTIRFDSSYVGTVDKKAKSDKIDISYRK